ncbi:MAG: carboxymuconolactone decarboxylase [Candidatus Methanoperedens nitroreducens]|uniref:Carboxymuconolactone decarboxylase n=1 Tax=Candidatus Methanoperedens nitratireducens TaxID=1392998 RepID=A0A0P7ZAY0_9EURY|nr:carboxymuconolactone decarboxylase family protein [Candidatus Methanoperedens sp. BLZ2]KAB2944795.1 MAG: carboxymuconolactone decarboxylase family protein [Candidatus Methanoperedens sp.]KPQ41703.1 MAG: carboxymuconolactone decarboxylase [Candidatus Methanoperedens sp. BLZ1]MBZ0177085.1 carboxymuconolactone decarboxylase family protein [Candidatus Methanoperedens nitroreducens]CAG0953578.1 4-carboxymuconolactone decarboxylase [Methanosarcinales archaeon]MCX9077516.1 carboxymuconolactone dec
MEPKKVIDSIEGKMGFTPEIMNMMGEMNPDMFEHYKKCDDQIQEDGALSAKVKVLMSLAVMAAQRCEPCCESQMRSALNHGATKEEIMETMNVIFITSGAPGVAACRRALKLIEGTEGREGYGSGHGCMPGRKRQ